MFQYFLNYISNFLTIIIFFNNIVRILYLNIDRIKKKFSFAFFDNANFSTKLLYKLKKSTLLVFFWLSKLLY